MALETIVVDGHVKPLVEKNILPAISESSNQFGMALLLAFAGIGLILLIELVLNRPGRESVHE